MPVESFNREAVEDLQQFLAVYCQDQIADLVSGYPRETRSLVIDHSDLFRFDSRLADVLLENPEHVIEHIEEALRHYDMPVDLDFSDVNIRVAGLNEAEVFDVGEYTERHIGNFMGVRGQISQLSAARPAVEKAEFECQRCGTLTTVPQVGNDLQEPHECGGCERQGPFRLDTDLSTWTMHQVARLELPPEKATGGTTHVDLHLNDDLAGELLEGNERVIANAKLDLDVDDPKGRDFDFKLESDAGGQVEVTEGGFDDIDLDQDVIDRIEEIAADDPIATLVDSLAPQLTRDDDLEQIMEALLLQLVGAADRGEYRSDSHVLLLGDPGVAKSELLEAVEEVAPRAKYASGEGLTQAGMTAAAVKDDFGPSQWSLKAGLLVRANGGIACIDEIDKAGEKALESAHTALENQRVSVAKAGIEADLPTNTALLAAGNPKHGRFDQYEPISEQIDIQPALMSRFDLMYMMEDTPEPERDREIADHIVEMWAESAEAAANGEDSESHERDVETETFRAYIAYARENIQPTFSPEAKKLIREFYVDIRSRGYDEDSAVPVTARKLEANLRIAEASARARLSDTVEKEDAKRAMRLVRKSLEQVGVDPETGELDADVVETGTSHSQRKRMQSVKAIISGLEEDHDGGAPIDEVLDLAEEKEMERSRAEHAIEKIKREGTAYEPQPDHLRLS